VQLNLSLVFAAPFSIKTGIMNQTIFCTIAISLLFLPLLCTAQASYDDSESLYYPGDNVTIFHAGNLKETLTSSSTMWLVEYYSSWCGHCHEFAPVYKALARDISGWSWIFRIGSMNCGAVAPNGEENYLVCHRSPFWVFDYPDFRFYPSKSDENNKGELLDETNLIQMKDYRNEILKYIETNLPALEWERETPKPVLTPITTTAEIEKELTDFKTGSTEYLTLVFEKEDSSMGKEIILDMSSCKNITTRSVTTPSEASLYLTDHYNITIGEDGTHIAVLSRNNSVLNIDVKMKTRYFYVYKLQRLDGVGDPVAKNEVVVKDDGNYQGDSPVFSDDLSDALKKVNVEELDRIRYLRMMRAKRAGALARQHIQQQQRRRHTEL